MCWRMADSAALGGMARIPYKVPRRPSEQDVSSKTLLLPRLLALSVWSEVLFISDVFFHPDVVLVN